MPACPPNMRPGEIMRSGLQPVAISCNKNCRYAQLPARVDARMPSENASDAFNVLRKPNSMRENECREIVLLRTPVKKGKEEGRGLYAMGQQAPSPM